MTFRLKLVKSQIYLYLMMSNADKRLWLKLIILRKLSYIWPVIFGTQGPLFQSLIE